MATCLRFVFCSLLFLSQVFAQEDYVSRNLKTIQGIYDLTVYPKNVPILQQGAAAVPPGLFSQDVAGRITPVGNFTGFADSIEYFFALAPTPQLSTSGMVIYKAEIVEFNSGCPDVASSVVYLRTGKVDSAGNLQNSSSTSTLKQIAFWKFDDQGQVLRYDAWIPNLQVWSSLANGADLGNPLVDAAARVAICPTIQDRCTGPNQQYDGIPDCVAQLAGKPFGSFDEAWGDNIACRSIHIILTQVRPEVHCPHVGPKGGNGPDNYKCVDIDYSTEYVADTKIFGEAEGTTFMCSNQTYSRQKRARRELGASTKMRAG